MNTLIRRLTKRRAELKIVLGCLAEDVNKAPLPRKFAVAAEIAEYKLKLKEVEEQIKLEEQWALPAYIK